MPARNTVNKQVIARVVGHQIAPPARILALASWETSLSRAPAGWAFRPADLQPVLATADPGGEGIRHCPPAPWFATVWFPMRNGPPPWLITTRVHDAHYCLVWRSAARAHAKIFKVLHLSSRLEIRPEIENTSHQICRLNISRPFDASRGSDKNFVCRQFHRRIAAGRIGTGAGCRSRGVCTHIERYCAVQGRQVVLSIHAKYTYAGYV